MNTLLMMAWAAVALMANQQSALTTNKAQISPPQNDTASALQVPAGMQRYVIPISGCAIEFVARKGGLASEGGGSVPYPYGSYEGSWVNAPKKRRPISFILSCRPGKASELCPKLMAELREHTPEMIQDTKMRNLSHLNPQYYTDAVIGTNTGVPTPRSRDISFCMGDDTRTLITDQATIIGYDPREIVESRGKPILKSSEVDLPEVLNIIKSIRFVPQQPAAKVDSSH